MQVLFFFHLPAVTGCAEASIDAGPGLSADAVWTTLETRFPGIIQYRAGTRLARNREYVGADAVFHDGDEVALIPPVSGG